MDMIKTDAPTTATVTSKTVTAAQDAEIISTNFDAIASCIYSLRDRWSDEREYEDFADYAARVRGFFEQYGMTVVSVSKAFKVTFATGCVATFAASGKVAVSAPRH